MPNTLQKKWEARLAKHGLSARQIDDQGTVILPIPASASHGIQNHQFDKAIQKNAWQDTVGIRLGEEQVERFHEVPVTVFRRNIPEWTQSDTHIQTLLAVLFPKMFTKKKHRAKAAVACALIYRYFRLCEPAGAIATDLRVSVGAIESRIERIKTHALQLGF
jgi:hypothetical protein